MTEGGGGGQAPKKLVNHMTEFMEDPQVLASIRNVFWHIPCRWMPMGDTFRDVLVHSVPANADGCYIRSRNPSSLQGDSERLGPLVHTVPMNGIWQFALWRDANAKQQKNFSTQSFSRGLCSNLKNCGDQWAPELAWLRWKKFWNSSFIVWKENEKLKNPRKNPILVIKLDTRNFFE